MKKFKEAEIKSMIGMVKKDMISFSRFVELINERIDEKPIKYHFENPFDHLNNEDLKEHMSRREEQIKSGNK